MQQFSFYERLFDPATTRRVTAGGFEGLQPGPRDVLGLRVEMDPPHHALDPLPPPERRMPEALAWIGETDC